MQFALVGNIRQFGERLVNENDGDEAGKTLLSKSRDVSDEGAEVEDDHGEEENRSPDPDPEAK